jgi:hypothetical protein
MRCTTRIAKGSGYKCIVGNNVFSPYCIRNDRRYIKYDNIICGATGYIDGETFAEAKQYTQYDDTDGESQRLKLLERCRKRASDEPTYSLRPLDTFCWKYGLCKCCVR